MTQDLPEEKVNAYCRVCKSLTPHSVHERTKAKKTPKRVQCQSCQDSHPFRANPPSKKKAATKPKADPAGSYDSLTAGRDLSLSVKYEMSREFAESDLLEHASFGIGVVVRVQLDRKIDVRFPDSTKTLVHARQ
jgi:hypothetical protein